MKTLALNCFDITIGYNPANIQAATISSTLKEPIGTVNDAYDASIDALESLILAHFCAGIDVSTSAYIEGIETAVQALMNNVEPDEKLPYL